MGGYETVHEVCLNVGCDMDGSTRGGRHPMKRSSLGWNDAG